MTQIPHTFPKLPIYPWTSKIPLKCPKLHKRHQKAKNSQDNNTSWNEIPSASTLKGLQSSKMSSLPSQWHHWKVHQSDQAYGWDSISIGWEYS